ncbi:MAG: phosphopantothenoylcysteine decarboxylase [Saprospiraceae bacterium]
MGISIAKAFVESGAEVTLILGPTSIQPDNTIHKVERIQTSDQMFEKVQQYFAQSDIIILAAAVADYKPAHVSDVKMKKKDDELVLELKTIDIAAHFGTKKTDNQVFGALAQRQMTKLSMQRAKLNKKNFDFIVLNLWRSYGAGFAHDTNRITILDKSGDITNFDLKSKTEVAFDIVNYLSSNFLK